MAHQFDVQLGAVLRKHRAILGWSQAQLAKRLGLSFQQVQKYETGANRVSARRLYDMAKIFSVNPAVFFQHLDVVRDGMPNHEAMIDFRLAGMIGRLPGGDVKASLYGLVKGLLEETSCA